MKKSTSSEKISELMREMRKYPKNIIIMKELGDLYLNQKSYEDAINIYTRMISLKPEVNTKRVVLTYCFGLNNLGVAFALSKMYDKAIEMFKEAFQHSKGANDVSAVFILANEGELYHYLGLFKKAINTYKNCRSLMYSESELIDEMYEYAYMETFLKSPSLRIYFLKENSETDLDHKRLDTPVSMALQECSSADVKDISDRRKKIIESWLHLEPIEFKTDYKKIISSPSLSEINKLARLCEETIAEYESLIASRPESECNEYALRDRNVVLIDIKILKHILSDLSNLLIYLSSRQNYSEENWEILTSDPMPFDYETYSSLMDEADLAIGECNKQFDLAVKKWEEVFEKERIYWKQILCNLECDSNNFASSALVEDMDDSPTAEKPVWLDVLTQANAYDFGLDDTFQNQDRAIPLYEQAAHLGAQEAYLRLAELYADRGDTEEGLRWLMLGGESGAAECWAELAMVYSGKNVYFDTPPHPENARKAWRRFFRSVEPTGYDPFGGVLYNRLQQYMALVRGSCIDAEDAEAIRIFGQRFAPFLSDAVSPEAERRNRLNGLKEIMKSLR